MTFGFPSNFFMEFKPNPGKNLIREVKGKIWLRYPVKTHFVGAGESLEKILEKYVLPYLKENDIVVLGQKIVSLSQGKIIYKKDLKVGFWAKFLSKFAKKTPYGFSVGNPLKMQIAINLAGLPRIFFAGVLGALSKLLGVSGNFYRLAGHQISRLDGFYGGAFSQYEEMGILPPKNCSGLCDKLKEKYDFSFVVADINDFGGTILGRSRDLKGKEKLIPEILRDNPAGQADQQTPILLIREQ